MAYLFDDAPSCDVDLGVKHHHDNERQVEGADGSIELNTQNSHMNKTQANSNPGLSPQVLCKHKMQK